MTPLGTDKLGNAYWYHMDPKDAAVRVYKDDPDEETWELAAETEAELQVCPISQLYIWFAFCKENALGFAPIWLQLPQPFASLF